MGRHRFQPILFISCYENQAHQYKSVIMMPERLGVVSENSGDQKIVTKNADIH